MWCHLPSVPAPKPSKDGHFLAIIRSATVDVSSLLGAAAWRPQSNANTHDRAWDSWPTVRPMPNWPRKLANGWVLPFCYGYFASWGLEWTVKACYIDLHRIHSWAERGCFTSMFMHYHLTRSIQSRFLDGKILGWKRWLPFCVALNIPKHWTGILACPALIRLTQATPFAYRSCFFKRLARLFQNYLEAIVLMKHFK